jgi:MoaA/NifB/PqqE/SkfB family radical SAM enzyme
MATTWGKTSEHGETAQPAKRGKIRLSGAGVHWFDRVSGLNVLVDESSPPPDCWHRAPRYVSIALTNACELRCPFCYAPKQPARLSLVDVLAWIEELDREGCLGVGFGGGEPTAYPGFAELCEQAANSTSLAITFTTHGHRIDRSLARRLRGSVHFIRISMDGIGATYERLRGRSFRDFEEHLAHVSEICPFGLNVVINDETVRDLDKVAAFARSVGAREILLLPERPAGQGKGISDPAMRELEEWILGKARVLPLSISEADAAPWLGLADPYGRTEHPLDAHAHVDAWGRVKPHAYQAGGVPIDGSILDAIDALRREEVFG